MKRIEAGTTPPLNPHTPSRLSAFLSRKLFSHKPTAETPFGEQLREVAKVTTEQFRTNYDALLRITREELESVQFTIPEKKAITQEATSPITVGIASGNSIKNEEMERLLAPHKVNIHRIPEAEEEHTLNAIRDARSKALDAARIIQESEDNARRNIRTKEHVTISNDVLNAVPIVTTNSATGLREVTYQRLGKPGTLTNHDGTPYTPAEQVESVRQTFKNMFDLAMEHGWDAVPYIAEIATVIHNPKDPQNDAVSTQKTAIFLSPVALSYLASPIGFADYIQRVSDNGFNIKKIAGGLELKVMEEMGLSPYITGTPSDISSPTFAKEREEAANHAYRIALGHADERLIAAYFKNQDRQEN